MEPGDVVSLKVKKTEAFDGEIIGYAFEENWNIYYVSLENSPVQINIGEKVSYEFVIAESLNCLVIPKEVLYEYHGRQFVYVLDERGLRRERYVVAGISDSMRVEIVSGLEEGDLIIQY
jgi:macrolide-specific efflux system membrane fusion protein